MLTWQAKLSPAVHNLLVGFDEAKGDPAKLMQLGAGIGKAMQQGGAAEDRIADLVESLRQKPVMLAARDTGTMTDAPQETIGNIPRNHAQEAMGSVGAWIQNDLAPMLDSAGIKIKLPDFMGGAELNPTLKDLTIGDIGRVLEEMSYGFYPVKGGNVATGGIGTVGLKPDALELLNALPAGLAAKASIKAAPKVGKAILNTALDAPASGSMASQRGALFPHDTLKALTKGEANIDNIASQSKNPKLADSAIAHMKAIDAILPNGDISLKKYSMPGGDFEWRAGTWQSQGERHLSAGDGMYLKQAGFPSGKDFLDSLDYTPRRTLEKWQDPAQPRRVMYVFRDVMIEKDGHKTIPSVTVDTEDRLITNVVLRPADVPRGAKKWEPDGYKKAKAGD